MLSSEREELKAGRRAGQDGSQLTDKWPCELMQMHDGFIWPGLEVGCGMVIFENYSEISGLEVDFCVVFALLEKEMNLLASTSWREITRFEQIDGNINTIKKIWADCI